MLLQDNLRETDPQTILEVLKEEATIVLKDLGLQIEPKLRDCSSVKQLLLLLINPTREETQAREANSASKHTDFA